MQGGKKEKKRRKNVRTQISQELSKINGKVYVKPSFFFKDGKLKNIEALNPN